MKREKLVAPAPIDPSLWCWFCGESKGRIVIAYAEKQLIHGVAAKICDECVTLCAHGVTNYKLTRAINGGAENVTMFVRRARRPVPTLEVVA
jgi:hypothetical protein